MEDPYWLGPNRQDQSAYAGGNATNVGRDQYIYNQAKSRNDVSLDIELLEQGFIRQYESKARYERMLADAGRDFRALRAQALQLQDDKIQLTSRLEEISAEVDELHAKNDGLRRQVTAVRLSRAGLLGLLVVALVVGGVVSRVFFGGNDHKPTASRSSGVTYAGPPSITTVPPASATPLPAPEYTNMTCGQGQFLVQLEAISPKLPAPDFTAYVLRQELLSRIKDADMNEPVLATRAAAYCEAHKPDLKGYIFLWSGPFSTKDEADSVCAQFRAKAVSEDCYSVPMG